MRWRLPIGVAVALTVAVVLAVLVTTNSTSGFSGGRDGAGSAGGRGIPSHGASRGPVIDVTGQTVGPPVRAGFLGFSLEFSAVRAYTGADTRQINPVLVQLIRALTPDQAPVLRIGGDSSDVSYVPARGVARSPFANYALTPSWLATTSALAHELGARMTLGLNLAADEPALSAAEARAYLKAFGRHFIRALEIGNEPNVYGKIALFRTPAGARLAARPRDYGYPRFRREFRAIAAAAPSLPLAGPALAVGPTAGPGSWVQTIPDFLARQPRVQVMTVHRYPLRNCFVPPSSPQYPTIDHLLSSYASLGLADSLRRWLAIAHAHRRPLRVDELNSVACRGKSGVSDTFASSLWVVDALFALARLGVDGVNVHTLPGSAYAPFAFDRSEGRWRAQVKPLYYGLQLFASAAPAGSRLLKLTGVAASLDLSVWATRGLDHRVRVVLINRSRLSSSTITLRPPRGTGGQATVERMQAPSVGSRGGVTIGGRTYGAQTYTGTLRPLEVTRLTGRNGAYAVVVPRASAELLTFGG